MAVGDDVTILVDPDGSGMIENVAERRTMFFRPSKRSENVKQVIAANIDQLAVVASVKSPDLKPGLIDRFLISAEVGNLKPIIIINKIDLGETDFLDDMKQAYSAIDIPIFFISAKNDSGLDNLKKALIDHRTIFAGHSGVGKSTILNNLMPGMNIRVAEISDYSNKGVHTTTSVELYELPFGGYVVDSPGLKVLGLWEVEQEQLAWYFPEMQEYLQGCRFSGCTHLHEPDCAVKKAVKMGEIPEFRYKSYITIYNSLDTD